MHFTVASLAITALYFCCSDAFGVRPHAAARSSLTSMRMASSQLPAEAKRYFVRQDRILDILGSAPQLLLRLGSGALVDGYRCENKIELFGAGFPRKPFITCY